MERIRMLTRSYETLPGLPVFRKPLTTVAPAAIPGLDRMRHPPRLTPPCVAPFLVCQRLHG
jgi:hypothetical protein